jgi:Ubiquitin-2 like Rad60 SUMO-like
MSDDLNDDDASDSDSDIETKFQEARDAKKKQQLIKAQHRCSDKNNDSDSDDDDSTNNKYKKCKINNKVDLKMEQIARRNAKQQEIDKLNAQKVDDTYIEEENDDDEEEKIGASKIISSIPVTSASATSSKMTNGMLVPIKDKDDSDSDDEAMNETSRNDAVTTRAAHQRQQALLQSRNGLCVDQVRQLLRNGCKSHQDDDDDDVIIVTEPEAAASSTPSLLRLHVIATIKSSVLTTSGSSQSSLIEDRINSVQTTTTACVVDIIETATVQTLMDRILIHYLHRKPTSNVIGLRYNQQTLYSRQTLDMYNIPYQSAVIHATIHSSDNLLLPKKDTNNTSSSSASPLVTENIGTLISVILRRSHVDSNGKQQVDETPMKIGNQQPLQALVDQYVQLKQGDIDGNRTDVTLQFDGDNINLQKSTTFYEMDHDDLIDVVLKVRPPTIAPKSVVPSLPVVRRITAPKPCRPSAIPRNETVMGDLLNLGLRLINHLSQMSEDELLNACIDYAYIREREPFHALVERYQTIVRLRSGKNSNSTIVLQLRGQWINLQYTPQYYELKDLDIIDVMILP